MTRAKYSYEEFISMAEAFRHQHGHAPSADEFTRVYGGSKTTVLRFRNRWLAEPTRAPVVYSPQLTSALDAEIRLAQDRAHSIFQERIAVLSQDMEALATDLEATSDARDSLNAQLATRTSERDRLQGEANRLSADNQRMSDERDAAREKVAALGAQIADRDKECARLMGQLDQLQTQMQQLRSSHDAALGQLAVLSEPKAAAEKLRAADVKAVLKPRARNRTSAVTN